MSAIRPIGLFLALIGVLTTSTASFVRAAGLPAETLASEPELPADQTTDVLFGGGALVDSAGAPTAVELQGMDPSQSLSVPPLTASAPDSAQSRQLVELARKVAPAVVSLRAWDGSGNELARGSGWFVDSRGRIATDMQLVHPDFAGRIEYITASTGSGTAHRVTGYWTQDLETGITLLQSDATSAPSLPLRTGADFSEEKPVSVVALHEERDLSLADAVAQTDETRAGEGWLNVRGQDSPGEPGSPLIDASGRVVAMVSMRVPQGKWFNFATRVEKLSDLLQQKADGAPLPLAALARRTNPSVAQDSRFLRAFQLLADGDALRATPRLLTLLKSHPRSAEVWALLGLAYAKLGAKEEALNCNRKAVALDSRVGQYWYQLAISYLSGSGAKPNPAAREALDKAVEQRPGDRIAWLLLAEQEILRADYLSAEKALAEVAKLEPDYAPASFLLGYAKGRQGDYAAAEEAMRRCLQLNRKHPRASFYLALLYTKQKRFAEAVKAYEETVRIEPKHPSAWRNLALLQRKLGHDTAAGVAFQRHQRLGGR